MIKFSCLQNFIDIFSCRVAENISQLISIDGVDGSGKSYLSEFLVKEKGYSYIDIDGDYLIPNDGKYIEFIRYNVLKADVIKLLSSRRIIVIDGICILKILENIDLEPDIKVYVKKIIFGEWRDGRLFDYSCNIEDVLAAKRKEAQKMGSSLCLTLDGKREE
jgi:uridine kinase